MNRFRATALLVITGLSVLSGCGYGLAGKADLIPKSIHTIAVPPFHNTSTRYSLTDRLPNMIARELISRTRYQVILDPTEADAVLNGSVLNIYSIPTVMSGGVSNRAAGIELQVSLAIELRERVSGNLLYSNPNYVFRQRYEISVTPGAYFDESSVAFQRLSQDLARSVVSGILENF